VYVPYRGEPEPVPASLLVRGRPGVDVAASVSEEVRHVDAEADMTLYMTFSMKHALGFVTSAQRLFGSIFLLLAGIALVLSSVGLRGATAEHQPETSVTEEAGGALAAAHATSKSALGFLAAINSSVRAAPEGARRPCSHSCSVRTETPSTSKTY